MSETSSNNDIHLELSKFPEGLNVLVVETNVPYLQELVELLRNFQYEVTKCSGADEALSFLKDGKEKFDVLVADFDTLDMNEFDFLSSAIAASSLPIIAFSENRDPKYIEKGLVKGASAFFEKPLSKEAMGMLWQVVIRQKHLSRTSSSSDITITTHQKTGKKHVNPRFVWTKQVEALFVEAVNYHGGPDNAVPKSIHEYMLERGMKGLNSRHISSHLQKYRMDMKLMRQQQQQEESSSAAQQMHMQYSSVPFPMLNNKSSSTLVPNYLPYKPSNPIYPSSVLPRLHNHNNNMGMSYSSQTDFLQGPAATATGSYLEPCPFLNHHPNNGESSSSYQYPARTILSQFNTNPNHVTNCHDPSNYDHVALSGNEYADYQIAMEGLMEKQYHQQLPFDDQDQHFLSYTDDDVALIDELAAFNQEDVKCDQGGCG